MHENEKARRYEAMSPGTGIPIEQKAERYDRKAARLKNGLPSQHRRVMQGSITMPESASRLWCSCGRFKHEGPCS